jgi:hypothetical protein
VVLNDAGEVDRIWFYDWPVRKPQGPTKEPGTPALLEPVGHRAGRAAGAFWGRLKGKW